jgi:uroporphyrinogen-III synthase
MLELPEMKAVAGKRIVVFRGDGGRELLGQTLRQRGAVVDYVESYQRVRPRTDANPLMSFWARGGIDVFTVTSSQSLHNLFELVGSLGQQWLRETPLVVIGKRTADLAARMGLKRPALLADEASDEGIVRKLIEWRAS